MQSIEQSTILDSSTSKQLETNSTTKELQKMFNLSDILLFISALMLMLGMILLVVGSILNLAVGSVAAVCWLGFIPVLFLSIIFE